MAIAVDAYVRDEPVTGDYLTVANPITRNDVYFWQNIPSHIQTPGIVALANRWHGQVHCVWESPVTEDRQQLGWRHPEMTGVTEHLVPQANTEDFARSLLVNSQEAIHIFSGMDSYPLITSAFRAAKQNGLKRLGLMVEPGIKMGWRGKLRPLRAKLLAQKYIPSIRLVLAMGQTGTDFYCNAGFPSEIVFPYMYQAPSSSIDVPPAQTKSLHHHLVYVGKFIPRKGVDVLLRALAKCTTKDLHLRIIGTGKEESALRELAGKLGISNRLSWEGAKPHHEVLKAIQESDLCIVPSRFEGWGVVVNEAIGVETPVICSDTTTARDLVNAGECGSVFANEHPGELAAAIDQILGTPGELNRVKANAKRYRAQLTPDVVAGYLQDVLEHTFGSVSTRPEPPWQTRPVHA